MHSQTARCITSTNENAYLRTRNLFCMTEVFCFFIQNDRFNYNKR